MASTSVSTAGSVVASLAAGAADLVHQLGARGFALVEAAEMRRLLGEEASLDAGDFADSWNDLPLDEYMADGGRYRRRRHAVFAAAGDELVRQPHQPHYQSLRDNPLNGGVARWFAPVRDDIADGPSLRSAIRVLTTIADGRRGKASPWRVEVHQFRIESRAGEAGQPTPEGMHRDGVDFVLAMLIARFNVAEGVSTISNPDGTALVRVQLAEQFDSMVLDDARVRHGVSPIRALDPASPAFRDVLVVTLTGPRS
ncbi:MAG TPA: 2OG-Fe dioxygenase family protein [Vicinamibacterales bacterium]|nr:2OG-Fe dioxygenase family protein [Vicinamibacterales bacterium]